MTHSSLDDRRIDYVPELPAEVKGGRRHQLRHEYDYHVLLRIHPEDSRGRAAPVVVAAAECARFDLSKCHREAESEAYSLVSSLREGADSHRAQVFAACQVVKMHQLDGARSQYAHAVQFTAAAQHFAEAQIIGGGARQSSAARIEGWLLKG